MTPSIEMIIIGCLVASAAAIPGTCLILRQVAMLSDAISHAVLLGIVIMFLIVKNLQSPLLMIAATITGLITVAITEWFIHSKKMKKDAAIGLVFPVFFALDLFDVFAERYMSSPLGRFVYVERCPLKSFLSNTVHFSGV